MNINSLDSRNFNSGRVLWLDVMKGLGMIAVVCGHLSSDRFVYVFHMPLFFMISGFLMQVGRSDSVSYMRHSALRLLIPYFVFLLLFFVPELLHAMRKGNDIPGIELLYGGTKLQGRLAVFWFITVLFVATNIFNALLFRRYLSPILFVGFFCLGYVFSYFRIDLPWGLQVVPMAIFFMWVGNRSVWLYERISGMAVGSYAKIFAWIVVFSSFVVAWRWRDDLYMDMKQSYYGFTVLSVVMAIWLTYCIAFVSLQLVSLKYFGRFLALLGEASLMIMYLHIAVYRSMHTLPLEVTMLAATLIPLLIYLLVKRSRILSMLLLGLNKKDCKPKIEKEDCL